jgi:hypothetical protein
MSPLELLSAVPIAPADRAQIAAVRARLAEISAVATIHQPPRLCAGQPTAPYNHAHLEVDRLSSVLAENPTAENAMALSKAVAFEQVTPTAGPTILTCLAHGAAAASKELATITAAIIDAALADLDCRTAAALKNIGKTDDLVGIDVAGQIHGKAAGIRAALEAERPESQRDPFNWISMHGLAMDGQPEVAAPAPAPVPPAKPYRGKVRLDKTAEAETPADVLDQLADDSDVDDEDPLAILTAGT